MENTFSRGQHQLPQLEIFCSYPFGLTRSWKYFNEDVSFLVYPALRGDHPLPFSTASEDMSRASTTHFLSAPSMDEFKEHRAYRTYDSPQHIDWKVFARKNILMVKNYDKSAGKILHFSQTQSHVYSHFEDQVSQMAQWVNLAATQGFQYSFQWQNYSIPLSSGTEHYHQILRILAKTAKNTTEPTMAAGSKEL
ncbi:MAG: DUF58 domain-containing protein [Pseudobdellovibrionaceae bacterium]